MPIEEDYRFWAGSGSVMPRGPRDWYMTDFDQRCMFTVRMDDKDEEEETAIEHLKRHIDTLGPNLTFVHLSPDGNLVSVSSDPKHDHTQCVYYPPLSLFERPGGVQTVARTKLRELDRMAVNVDLVSYQAGIKPVVFKYYWHSDFAAKLWDELNLWMRLPPHPNIVPFDRLVLDEIHGNVVGFTSVFIPGGTLDVAPPSNLKLKWCQQLTQVIDDLNLRHGIWHQDIAPRNLLIDSTSDNIMLFDFNYSARVGYRYPNGTSESSDARNDVHAAIFTMYELITRDFHFRKDAFWQELTPAMVQDVEWVPHADVKLDRPVAEYRALLDAWVKKRAEGTQVAVYTDATEFIDWPVLEMPLVELRFLGSPSQMVPSWVLCDRRTARAEGREVVEWQRPMQSKLETGCHLLANGQVVETESAA